MIVGAILIARMMEFARRALDAAGNDAKRTGHAEMHQQHVAGCKIRHQVFGAASEPGQGLAFEPRHKIFLERKS